MSTFNSDGTRVYPDAEIDFAKVICVTNRGLFKSQADFLQRLEKIAAAGPKAVVLREKDMEPADYEALAKKVMAVCRRYDVPCILHQFSETAQKLQSDGLHLPLPQLRRLRAEGQKLTFPELGTSCHSVQDVREAMKLGCTYVFAGHIYATSCKPGLAPRGLTFLREAVKASSIPVYAIGGMTPARLPEVLAAGAAGGCAMSSLMTGSLWLS
ncbi:thiamine phosphate synthase [uncultured Mitsuokella sp.]|uniref:thiamine phosphate synthase n=1 Tax=uncultured Mitsuokella sp. TaxID=453120 RepID=UPI0025D7B829|nr:thiamine phosphate synthase [uncultured Mitsuokella sp.]